MYFFGRGGGNERIACEKRIEWKEKKSFVQPDFIYFGM